LVGWSPSNVGKKIESLWGQIEATQFMTLKIQIPVSFYILGIGENWGQIRAPEHFFCKSMSLFFISMVVGGGPVRWGPPKKMIGVRAPVVCWRCLDHLIIVPRFNQDPCFCIPRVYTRWLRCWMEVRAWPSDLPPKLIREIWWPLFFWIFILFSDFSFNPFSLLYL
jgi:hypothetical protein